MPWGYDVYLIGLAWRFLLDEYNEKDENNDCQDEVDSVRVRFEVNLHLGSYLEPLRTTTEHRVCCSH